jgi:hypothetical protein
MSVLTEPAVPSQPLARTQDHKVLLWRPSQGLPVANNLSPSRDQHTPPKADSDDFDATPGFQLSPSSLGLARLGPNPAGSLETTQALLQKNHEKWHMYFRNVAGHNHVAHAVLSTLAMGGGPRELHRAYDDGEPIQRAMPARNATTIAEMSDPSKFRENMMILDQYPNFLAFFKQEIGRRDGDWRAVVSEYCFSRTPLADLMLAQQFEGLYHPLIHTCLGVEFELPSIVAEGLAQAASHDPMYIDAFFQKAERLAQSASIERKPLIDLYHQCRENEGIRTAARLPDGPWRVRDGVLGRAMDEIVQVAAQFQVESTERAIEAATAEMISCAAYACAAAHKPGKERKIDFFLMHCVTSSIFISVMIRQRWISLQDKARLVEWKARLDLVWYAASAAPELSEQNLLSYQPTLSKGMDWVQLYQDMNRHHDDGHVAKFLRAIRNGEESSAPLEIDPIAAARLPVRGESWLKVAQMCYDSTISYVDPEKKWVWGVGFDRMWNLVPDASSIVELKDPDPTGTTNKKYLCLTICGYRKPGMSEEDYRNHMVNVSAPMTKALMVKYGVKRWTQIHNQTATRGLMTELFDQQMMNVTDFDCFSQVIFENVEDYKLMKQDPWYKEHLVDDHEKFADTKRSM